MISIQNKNMYIANWSSCKGETCLVARSVAEIGWLWHRRLKHLNFKTMNKISRNGLVRGIPNEVFIKGIGYEAC